MAVFVNMRPMDALSEERTAQPEKQLEKNPAKKLANNLSGCLAQVRSGIRVCA